MKKEWIPPKTITGDAATGEKYFRRDYINDEFWAEVQKGNHILFVAPRRVGKTSIMKDIEANPKKEYVCIYKNIQSVRTKNEFYEILFNLFLQCIGKTNSLKDFFKKLIKQYNIDELSIKGTLKISSKDINYEKEIKELIPQLKVTPIKTLIFLDEFAEVINTLNQRNQKEDAIDILHTLRGMRSDVNFSNFKLVYAGSIGLQFVIKSIDRNAIINDLHNIEAPALIAQEAKIFIRQITNGATIKLNKKVVEYLINKIQHLLPYYIQLMIEEIDLNARRQNSSTITITDIDNAFNAVIEKNDRFEDWLTRLKDYNTDHFPFINEILKRCAHNGKIAITVIYNIAIDSKYNRTDDYMSFINQLKHDGYLMESEKQMYKFISPFLKEFWLRQYPIYNEQ